MILYFSGTGNSAYAWRIPSILEKWLCHTGNIYLINVKPVWNDQCTHCMACICRCPKKAIEYGKHSKDLVRYTCPK